MRHWDDSVGPGRHRVNSRSLDLWRTDHRGFSSGRVLSEEEIEYFRNLRREKKMTPTEILYNKILSQRAKEQ